MKRLTAVIITRNEEANIERCLQSLSFADEIVIVDSHSEDRTVEIAARHNAVVLTTDWIGFGPAKQKGVDAATGEWVLSIDADEEVSPDLAEEIKQTAFRVTRVGELIGREVAAALAVPFGIVDLSLAPTPAVGDSIGEILNVLGLDVVG